MSGLNSDEESLGNSSAENNNSPEQSQEAEDKSPSSPRETSSDQDDGTQPQSTSEWLRNLFRNLTLRPEPCEQILEDVSFEGIARYIKSGKCKKIVTMAGAGISTSAGIPDFRSPDTGLYHNLQKYNLPHPQAIFELSFFKENPKPFFCLAKELWPGVLKPTPCHYFVKLLADKGLLLRHFTQNIDTLERVAGLNGDLIVEAHGTFFSSHCVDCHTEYSQEWIKVPIFEDKIPYCTECNGLVKPDIIFFGEQLPEKFFICQKDLKECDLLIIMGTSLTVQPFASLVSQVSGIAPRLYINLDKSNLSSDPLSMLLGQPDFDFESEKNYRDVFWQGTCDDGCQALADSLGFGDELKELVKQEHQRISEENVEKSQSE